MLEITVIRADKAKKDGLYACLASGFCKFMKAPLPIANP
jgi:hypothetical protein